MDDDGPHRFLNDVRKNAQGRWDRLVVARPSRRGVNVHCPIGAGIPNDVWGMDGILYLSIAGVSFLPNATK